MKIEEIKQRIRNYSKSNISFEEDYADAESFLYEEFRADHFKEIFGKVKKVEDNQSGGDFIIYHFERENIYVRIDAFYSSYGGWDFEDAVWSLVTPAEKTIVVFN